MSLRLSLVLIVLFAVSAIVVAWFIRNAPGPAGEPDPPYFYTLDSDTISRISITVGEQSISWHVRREDNRNRWYFDEPENIPVDIKRWGGITLLLGGPRPDRLLLAEYEGLENPEIYGLDDPPLKIDVTLRDGTTVALHIGNTTPDGGAHYARQAGMSQLQLIDSSWGQVLERLVNEPPYPGWYYGESLDPKIENIHQALFYDGYDLIRALGYNDDDYPDKEEGWYVCDIPVGADEPCTGDVKLDTNAVREMLQPILEPQIIAVEAYGQGETYEELSPLFDQYGAGETSPYVTLRMEVVPDSGVTNIWAISLSFGDLTSDGSEMYVVAMDSPDVLRADAEWAKGILDLYDAELPIVD